MLDSVFRTTSRTPFTASCVCEVIPTYENTSFEPCAVEIEYRPSRSVVVPWALPCTSTETPIRGSPSSSDTVPVVVTVCAQAHSPANQNIATAVTSR